MFPKPEALVKHFTPKRALTVLLGGIIVPMIFGILSSRYYYKWEFPVVLQVTSVLTVIIVVLIFGVFGALMKKTIIQKIGLIFFRLLVCFLPVPLIILAIPSIMYFNEYGDFEKWLNALEYIVRFITVFGIITALIILLASVFGWAEWYKYWFRAETEKEEDEQPVEGDVGIKEKAE